jgi:molybdopterin-guanine dinucleotide biosynthesis protein A
MAVAGIVGLILAGGRARRMAGRDKALLPFGTGNLLSRAADRLRPQCDVILLNASSDKSDFASCDLTVVRDSISDHAGPLAGILAGLDWMSDHAADASMLVTVPVDGPFFPHDLVARLRAAAAAQQVMAACARSGGRRHGVYGLWSPALRENLRDALLVRGIRKVDDWLAGHRVATVEWPDRPVDPFFNVNTPEDLAAGERYLKEIAGHV